MLKRLLMVFGMLLLLTTFVSAVTVNVSPMNPGVDDNLVCSVSGSTAGFDFYWYSGGVELLSAGNAHGLVLPGSMTDYSATYTCKVFRPSTVYVPEVLIDTVSVTVEDEPVPDLPECSDGEDNDGDGYIDMADPGCENPLDDDESDDPYVPQCSDGLDNDNDGMIDMADPGCENPSDDDEKHFELYRPDWRIPEWIFPSDNPECSDEEDNDGDGYIDMDDPGCESPEDDDESDDPYVPECSDTEDNDNDSYVDMDDPGCSNPDDDDESDDPYVPQCSDNEDNDNDGLVDMDDPGCSSPDDDDESDDPYVPECSDNEDNDNDGYVDMDDPGCSNPDDDDESDDHYVPECSDTEDNDNDGLVDMDDPGCDNADDDDESDDPVPPEEDDEPREKAKLEIGNVNVEVNGDTLEVMVYMENNGETRVNGVDIKYYIKELGVLERDGVSSIWPGQSSEVMHYISLDNAKAGKYTLMVEAVGDKGQHDVVYYNFELGKSVKEAEPVANVDSDEMLVFMNSYSPVKEEPVVELGICDKIWQWFAELFATIL